jgi:ATP-dependent DNA ligase
MNLQNGCRISRNRLEGGDTPWLAQNVSATSATYPDRANERIFLYAFDLIELSGDDLWRDPLEGRKATLENDAEQGRTGHRVQQAYRS